MNFPFQLLRRRLDKADINMLMKIKVFMFDCDGVLWRGQKPISGAIETLNYLKENGKSVYYCTNSSRRSRQATLDYLKEFGISSSLDEIITSSYVTAQYLKAHSNGGAAYVVGEQGIYDELKEVGIQCCGMEDNDVKDVSSLAAMNPSITSVVVGLDRDVNYVKLSRAAAYIRDQKCSFIATNSDAADPTDKGLVVGAAGSMVNAISAICGKQPDIILGKPGRSFLDVVLNQHPDLDPWDIMMVGDRLDTDIALARQVGMTEQINGLKSLCVLSGVTSEEEILKCDDAFAPQYISESVATVKDVFVFAEDMSNEDEEKQAIAELERLKQERREMKRKQREERRKLKEQREKEIAEGKKMMEEEIRKMDEEEAKKKQQEEKADGANGAKGTAEKKSPASVEERLLLEEKLEGEEDLKRD